MTLPSSEELDATLSRLRPIPFKPKVGGQCLQHALAFLLRLPADWLPQRLEHEDVTAWFGEVERRFHVELEYVHPDNGLPSEAETWLAILPSSQSPLATHAVVVHRGRVYFDPDDRRRENGRPLDLNDVRAAIRIRSAAACGEGLRRRGGWPRVEPTARGRRSCNASSRCGVMPFARTPTSSTGFEHGSNAPRLRSVISCNN